MRKTKRTYYFSVEGETEALYLRWLQGQINAVFGADRPISFQIKVEKNPVSYIKTVKNLSKITITHVFDCESADPEHQKRFLSTLDKMREAERIGKQIKYQLAYSNYTFELWMILHKADCFTPLAHRRQYLPLLNQAYGTQFASLDDYKREEQFNRLLSTLTLDDVRQAILRSDQIIAQLQRSGCALREYRKFSYYVENPSLSLHIAIKGILKEYALL